MAVSRRIFIGVIALVIALSAAMYYARSRTERLTIVASQPIVMKMRRSCEMCPNYTITLTGDGKLTYEGKDHTRVQGVRTVFVDSQSVIDLLTEFLHPAFLELDNIYPAPGTDRMAMALSIEMNGLSKSVLSEDGYGPAVLLELERKMDDLPSMRALSGWRH